MTNINQLIDKILDKWPAKIICFVLAVLIYILHQASLTEKRTIVIPLDVVEDGIVSHMNDLPSSVTFTMRGDADLLKSISSSELTATLNLNDITDSSTYNIPVNISLSDRLIAVDPLEIRVKPDFVSVVTEKKVVKFVELVPSTVGEVAKGYTVDSISINPPYIDVCGPESIVNTIDKVFTNRINISNAESSFSVDTNYYPLSKLISVENKGPYKVTVSLKQDIATKLYTDIPVYIQHLDEKLEIISGNKTVNVKFTGGVNLLDDYIPAVNFVYADFSEVTEPGSYEINLKYNVPAGLTVLEKSSERITVTVALKEEQPAAAESDL